MKFKLIQSIIFMSKLFFGLLFIHTIFLSTLFASTGKGQDLLNAQEIFISVELQQASLIEVFNQIESKSEFTFSYEKKDIDENVKIDLTSGRVSVADILKEVSRVARLTFKQINNNINVRKANSGDRQSFRIELLQPFTITGRVTSGSDNTGLPGVTVMEKGTDNGTVTNINGEYTINVTEEDAVLVFSFVGFTTQEVPVEGRTEIDVALVEDVKALEEVVVVGYGTETRANLTSAVASVKQENIEKYATGNVGDAIQGQMAGVEVTSNSGQPGSGVDIKIRGTSSLGNNNPLYLIDGVPSDINNISPNDIESIEVLKDGASAAIYGSRAANGVVLITTKRARAGEFRLNLNGYFGIESLANKIPVMNAEQHVRSMNQAYVNDGQEPFYSNSPESYGKGTDWSDEFYSTAPVQNINLNFAGGSETAKINTSLDYFDQEGIALNTGFKRLSARINSEFKRGKFTFTENMNAFISRTDNTNNNAVWRVLEMPPTVPIYNPDNEGGYGGTYGDMFDIMSPVAAQNLMTNYTKNDFVRGNFTINYEPINNLKIKLNTGGSFNNGYNSNHIKTYELGTLQNPLSSLSENRNRNINWLVEGTADYEIDLNKQNFKFLVGVSAQKDSYRNTYGYGRGLPNNEITVLGATTQDMSVGGTEWNHTLASQFGRLSYNFDDRYLASATIRRDGSSRFAADNRWGVFPSVSLGWRVANEAFFPQDGFFSDFKVRASYGELGNQEIGNYAFSALINSSHHYPFGVDQSLNFGATQMNLASPSIKWETNVSKNIGIDLSMLQNTLSFTFDYFENNSKDLLVRVPIPMTNGSNLNPYQNIGEIRNRGFELNANWIKDIGDFQMALSGNLSSVNNKVLRLGSGEQTIWSGAPYHLAENTTLTQEGGEVAAFHLIQTAGIFQSQEEIDNYTYTDPSGNTSQIQPSAVPGDIRFVDANNDGVIDAEDRVWSGSAMPDFTYGFNVELNWKNFDLSASFYGTEGNKIYNGTAYTIEGMANFTNMSTVLLNAWTEENPSDIPRLTRLDPNRNGRTSSDRFLEDGSYFRLRNLQLGYTVPSDFLEKMKVDRLRIYLAGQNLFTITDYTGYNPDIYSGLLNRGVDTGIYPYSKTFRIGLQVSL
jgi:TonB-linked SusC/RagA family outer membrane protein